MLYTAAGCVAAFVVLMWLAYFVPIAHHVDDAALYGFTVLNRGPFDSIANGIAHICDPTPFAVLAIAAIAAAAVTRGPRYAAAAAVLLVGANATTQLLKPALAHPRPIHDFTGLHVGAAAFPSGHATASMTLALAAVMIAPRAYRPLVTVLACVFTLAVSFSVVVLVWHFPSDTVGGFLVATVWALVALAALRYAAERWPEQGTMRRAAREAMAAPSAHALLRAAGVFAVVAGLCALARIQQLADIAHRYTALVAVGSAIAAAAALLLALVAGLTSRRP